MNDRATDHLFRHATAQVVAALTRELGAHRIDLAEEATQDAALKALDVWRFQGVPSNPRGWLYRVARNRALDVLRREANYESKLAQHVEEHATPAARRRGESRDAPPHMRRWTPPAVGEVPFDDAELALIFLCCHPRLSPDARIALTLRLAGGFSVDEIAAAFLAEPATIAQRIVRAKRTLAAVDDRVELTDPTDTAGRLDSVLEALYLLFNEGYDAHSGAQLVRTELCNEAIRMMRLIANDPRTALPHAHALLALMLFQASRLPARVDEEGELVLLADQDRSRWDRALIAEAFHHFDLSTTGERLTSWHVQAAIATAYAKAATWDAIDWKLVLMLYDQLYEVEPTPVVALNRAIALAHVEGPKAGLEAALPLLEHPAMRRYFLLTATLAAFAQQLGAAETATSYYRMALRLPCNDVERRFLEKRLQAVSPGTPLRDIPVADILP